MSNAMRQAGCLLVLALFLALSLGASALDPFIDESEDIPGTVTGFPDPMAFEYAPNDYYVFGSIVDLGNSRCYRTSEFLEEDLTKFWLTFDFGGGRPVSQVWGFRPYKHSDGTYHAYGSVHYGAYKTDVVHFVPGAGETWTEEHPVQHWVKESILVSNKEADSPYDGYCIRDDDGTQYLIINEELETDRNYITMRKMIDPDTVDTSWGVRELLGPEDYNSEDMPWALRVTESTIIEKHQGKWCLFYVAGYYDDASGKLGVAYSDTLVPAVGQWYQKVLIDDPGDVWGNGGAMGGKEVKYLLQSQKPDWPNYIGDIVSGPGMGSTADVEGLGRHLIFAGRRTPLVDTSGWDRYTWKVPITIDMSGSMDTWIVPDIPAGDLPGQASDPNPANSAAGVSIDADLSWTAGSGAVSHDVYFGTSSPPPFIGNQAGTTYDPGTMAYTTTYYWRIDEVNGSGTTTGVEWSFTTQDPGGSPPGQATNPDPADGATGVEVYATLSWTAGSGAVSHDVYYGQGTSPPPFIGNQTEATYDPGVKKKNKWYYWRIDEVNSNGTTTGVEWSFKTGVF